MGTKYQFECGGCDYKVSASGGVDRGGVAVVDTMVCINCREVVDILVGRWGRKGPSGDPKYDKDLNVCPLCGGGHLQEWECHKPCPKCGHPMAAADELLLWD